MQDLLREKKVPKARTRRMLITLMAVGLVWLVMTVLFCVSKIFGILETHAWLLFIYGIPITGIVCEVFCALWWNQVAQAISCSLIIWGIGLSLVLSFLRPAVFLLFVICAVLEILLVLFFLLKVQSRWRDIREKYRQKNKRAR